MFCLMQELTFQLAFGLMQRYMQLTRYTLKRTPSVDQKSPFELHYNTRPKISHLRPFGNPCVLYRKRTVAGKVESAGVKGTFLG